MGFWSVYNKEQQKAKEWKGEEWMDVRDSEVWTVKS